MVFSSFEFLHLFLPIALAGDLVLRRLPPRWPRLAWLLAASWVFYSWSRWDHLALVVASTATDWFCGRALARPGRFRRTLALGISLAVNLGLLAWFKYANLAADTLDAIARAQGGEGVAWDRIALPIGISFYTFQTLSYTIDVWRGTVRPARNPLAFATYVALFPQLVAGPIVRWRDLAPTLEGREAPRFDLGGGALRFCLGLGKKVLLADSAAAIADLGFGAESPDPALAWIAALAYAVQIYFDFSGYSDMAIGLGRMLGFRFPENFLQPYRATSITDFWRRWHVTLSTWLRDYLYIPLGGNRRGPRRTYLNLALVMLLGGLWHGAAWTFVLWGGLHGLWLAVERARGGRTPWTLGPTPLRIAATFGLVVLAWVPFRAESFEDAWTMLRAMAGLPREAISHRVGELALLAPEAWVGAGLAFLGIWAFPSTQRLIELRGARAWWVAGLGALAALASLASLAQLGTRPFLYFQF